MLPLSKFLVIFNPGSGTIQPIVSLKLQRRFVAADSKLGRVVCSRDDEMSRCPHMLIAPTVKSSGSC